MSGLDKPFRTGRTAAKRAAKEQSELIAKQRQVDEAALAEEEDVLARRRALSRAGRGGRSLLIRTGETGVQSTNLGGTT